MRQESLGFDALKSMPAQFGGRCRRCDAAFAKGAPILYDVRLRLAYGPCCAAAVRGERAGVRKAGGAADPPGRPERTG